jgi:hypothetical protein
VYQHADSFGTSLVGQVNGRLWESRMWQGLSRCTWPHLFSSINRLTVAAAASHCRCVSIDTESTDLMRSSAARTRTLQSSSWEFILALS